MKEGFIKITGEDNLFYDSVRKEYKHRMYCPYCGKYSGCWCYPDLDSIPMFEENRTNVYCTDVHFVLDNETVNETAELLRITIKPTMEEWNAHKIVHAFMENYEGDEYIPGGACAI